MRKVILFKILLIINFVAKTDDNALYEALGALKEGMLSIQKNAYKPLSYDSLAEGALKGMLALLDKHSRLQTAQDLKAINRKALGQYAGLGCILQKEVHGYRIKEVIKNSVAALKGLKVGDLLLSVEDVQLKKLEPSEIETLFQQKVVKLNLKRGQEQKTYVLCPTKVKLEAYKIFKIGSVLYLKIKHFHDVFLAENIEKEIRAFQKTNTLQGMVIDLRGNPGGRLETGLELCNLFLEKVPLIVLEARGKSRVYNADPKNNCFKQPLVVLIDETTASTAEIVAVALKENKRALLVGNTTRGKNSVQTLFTLPETDYMMQFTTHIYKTPIKGEAVSQGVTPHISAWSMSSATKRQLLLNRSTFKNDALLWYAYSWIKNKKAL